MKLEQLSAIDIGRKIAAREISSREAVTHFLHRISQLNSKIVAFTHVCADQALERARWIDDQIANGNSLGSLAGVPIAIKDILCTEGLPTTCGSRILKNYVAPYTATCVQKMERAGLVVVGKTNMDEFAMGASTETSIFGAAHNPWSLERTAGGSSGGSAAALAAGMAPLTIGTDTGGSIRQPAAFCGVCGLKPTYGRVSRYGLIAFASSLDQIGPMAHNVEDLAACLEVIAGHDHRDSTSLSSQVPQFSRLVTQPIAGLRVGVVRDQVDHQGLAPAIRQAVERSIDMLQTSGAKIVDVELPYSRYSIPTYYVIASCEASSNLARFDGAHYGFRAEAKSVPGDWTLDEMYCHSRSQGFGAEVKRRIMLGTFALSSGYYDAYYRKAQQVRRLIFDDYCQAFEKVDLILGPVTPTTAFRLGEKLEDPVQMYLGDLYTVGANLAGIPALSIPAGFDAGQLPVSVQLQGPPLAEDKLLCAAHRLQQAGLFQPQVATLS